MNAFLKFSAGVDTVNRWMAVIASFCVLAACLVSAGNAGMRYAFSLGSNAWLEMQWYLFAYLVMFGASYVLKLNEHVRVDLVYGLLSVRGKLWIDILGLLIFMLPATIYMLILSWPPAMDAWHTGEISPNAGGLVRWPARFALPIGFAMLTLQGISELIKRLAMITGRITAETHYERPLQ